MGFCIDVVEHRLRRRIRHRPHAVAYQHREFVAWRKLVAEPGLLFRLSTTATLVAGTAIVTWLAGQITRRGLGSGLWVIVAAPTLADLPHTIESLHNFQSQGVVSGAAVVWGAVFIVVVPLGVVLPICG